MENNKEKYWSQFSEDFEKKQSYKIGTEVLLLMNKQVLCEKNHGNVFELGLGTVLFTINLQKISGQITATDFSDDMIGCADLTKNYRTSSFFGILQTYKLILMDIISAIASINALIIAFLISRKKLKNISDKILIAWIINFAFHFAIPFCIEQELFFHPSNWGFIMGLFIVAHAPFIFVYTSSLTDPQFKVSFRNFYHFGFILIFILTFIPYLSLSPEERMDIVQKKQDLSHYMLMPMLMLLLIRVYFLVRTIVILFKHQYNIKQSFSYESKINLSWIKLIAYGFFGAIVLSFVLYGLVSARVINIYWMDYSLIIVNIILFFYIAYSGYEQSAIQVINSIPVQTSGTKEVEIKSKAKPKIAKPDLDENCDPVISELIQLMEKEKLYLEPELNIGTIANQLNIHAHKLSKLINLQLKKNFYEFVNEYRVKEFKILATNPKNRHISILGLGMDAGFNSKATFYRFFKNATGLTPSEFMKNYKF